MVSTRPSIVPTSRHPRTAPLMPTRTMTAVASVEKRPTSETVSVRSGSSRRARTVRGGLPVTVFEAGPDLSEESRASTFHPPTLDMLDQLGAAEPLIAQGLTAPQFQYRTKAHGVLAQFDFGAIADVTAHPYRVQCEQSKLTRILLAGGGANLPGLSEFLAGRQQVRVEVVNPMARLEIDTDRLDARAWAEQAPLYSVSVGLALRKVA